MTAPSATTTPTRSTLAESVEHFADGAEQALHTVRERVAPNAIRWASQAEELAHRGVSAMRDTSGQLRERAAHVSERGIQYVKDDPLKAVLIAAAAGALLMVLLGARSNHARTRHD